MNFSDSFSDNKTKRTLTRIQLDSEESENHNIIDLFQRDRNDSSNFCDVKISFHSNEAILLHKCLFGSISKYFDCLFQRIDKGETNLLVNDGDEYLFIKSFVSDVYDGSLCADSRYGEITKDMGLESDIGKTVLDKQTRQLLNRDRQGLRKFCDGVISTETCDFPVHKCVVAAHSEFFLKLFTTEMKEKYETVCDVTGIGAEVMGLVLDFIYTKEMWVGDDQFPDLLSAADYLCIPSLQARHIAGSMLDLVSDENKLEMWLVGKKFHVEELATRAETFIAAEQTRNLTNFHKELVDVDRAFVKDFIKIFQKQVSSDGLYGFVMQWIKHDMDKRMDMFGSLFKIVDHKKLSNATWKKLLNEEVLLSNNIVASNAVLQYTKQFVPDDEYEVVSVSAFGHSSHTESGLIFAVCGDTNCLYRCELSLMNPESTSGSSFTVPQWTQMEGDANVWPDLEDRHNFSLVYGGGRLYFLGGYDCDVIRATDEVVSCNDDEEWSYEPSMLEKRHSAGALYYNGRIYVAGGIGYNKKRLDSMECYYRGQWTMLSPMLGCRASFAFLPYKGLLHAIGGVGRSDSPVLEHEVYSLKNLTWCLRAYHMENLTDIKLATLHYSRAYIVNECDREMKLNVFDLNRCVAEHEQSSTAETIKLYATLILGFPNLETFFFRLKRNFSRH